MKRSFLLAVAIFFAINNFAQIIDKKDVPKNVTKEFSKLFKKEATNISWEKDSLNFKAFFVFQEEARTLAWFMPTGKWIQTATEIDMKAIPSPASKYVKTHFKKQPIEKVYHILKPKNEVNFEAIVNETYNDKKYKVELYFDEKGEFLRRVAPAQIEKYLEEQSKVLDKKDKKDFDVNEDELSKESSDDKVVTIKELPTKASQDIKKRYPVPTYKILKIVLTKENDKTIYKVSVKKEGKKDVATIRYDFKGDNLDE